MKKIIIVILSIILAIQIVYSAETDSLTVREATNRIIDEFTSEDKLFYIFNEADKGAFLAVYFGLFSDNANKYEIKGNEFLKSVNEDISESDLDNRNIAIFGGPCANKYWSKFSDETCENWPYEPGQSIVKVVDNNGFLALLIAGTDEKDTFEIARTLLQYNTNDNLAKSSSYLHTSSSKRVTQVEKCAQETRDYTCFRYPYNTEFIYKKNDYDYSIILKNINDVGNIITFTLNGNPESLELGESITENGIEITPDKIYYSPVTAEPQEVEFHFSEPMEGFKPWGSIRFSEDSKKCGNSDLFERKLFYLPNNNVPFEVTVRDINSDESKVDIIINGKMYSGVDDGSVIDTINGQGVRLSKIQRFEILKDKFIDSVELCFE